MNQHHSARAYTLIELVMTMAISSLLIGAMTSVVWLATSSIRAAPDEAIGREWTVGRALNRIVAELRYARHLSERTTTSLAFTVPDRDGDGTPERIRYAVTAESGALTRAYNDEPPEVILSDVGAISFDLRIGCTIDRTLGLPVQESEERLIVQHDPAELDAGFVVQGDDACGQYFEPLLPADAVSWTMTRFGVRARRISEVGNAVADIRIAGDALAPTGDPVETALLITGLLSSESTWYELPFVNASELPAHRGYDVTFRPLDQTIAVSLDGGSGGSGAMTTSDGGVSWVFHGDEAIAHYAYGRIARLSGKSDVVRCFASALAIDAVLADAPGVRVTADLLNRPELVSGVWEADFNVDPTTLDVNGDGFADWAGRGGDHVRAVDLVGGRWSPPPSSILDIVPARTLDRFSTVRMSAQSLDVSAEAVLDIAVATDAAEIGQLRAIFSSDDAGRQTFRLLDLADGGPSGGRELINVGPLPDAPVNAVLRIDPRSATVAMRIDGVDRGARSFASGVPLITPVGASISVVGGDAFWDHISVREGGERWAETNASDLPTNRAPVAVLSASQARVSPGETVQLDASRSEDPDGDTLAFEWSLGDGTRLSSGSQRAHVFGAPGVYDVIVLIRDGAGGSAAAARQVVVESPDAGGGG